MTTSRTSPLVLALVAALPLGLTACSKGSSGSATSESFLLIGQGDPDPLGPDSDGDGLSDLLESRGWLIAVDFAGYGVDSLQQQGVFSNVFDPDSDDDGIDDYTEFQLRLNPKNPDTDLDGLSDHDEIEIWLTKPTSVDSDGDSRGPDRDNAPDARLFDGNEVRLLCDGSHPGSTLCTHPGTSPTMEDTDGDGRTDYEELDLFGFSPLIAELPEAEIDFAGEIDLRLNIEYAESLGEETQYGTSISNTESSSSEDTSSSKTGWSVEVTAGYSTGSFGTSGSVTAGYSGEKGWSHTESSSKSMTEESSRYLTESRNRSEAFSSGSISLGMVISNPTDVTFELQNLGLALIQMNPANFEGDQEDIFKTLGLLRPEFESFVLGPGEVSPVIPVSSTDVNADVMKELLARPDDLFLRPLDVNLLDAEGRNLDFLQQITNGRTAVVEIDFGGIRGIERYRVATNAKRQLGGGLAGLTIAEAMNLLGFDYTATEDVITSLDGVDGCSPQAGGDPCFPLWVVTHDSDQYAGVDTAPIPLPSMVLLPGDILQVVLITDADRDGLPDALDSEGATNDTDGDLLLDIEEVRGWEVTAAVLDEMGNTVPFTRRVASHIDLRDTDGDGLSDYEESPMLDMLGNPTNLFPSDPTDADTDRDGLLDSFDQFRLSPARVLRVDPSSTAATPDGLTWETAYPSIAMAASVLQAANDSVADDEVSELWVARGDHEVFSLVSLGNVSRFRMYGGFQGFEDRRDQREENPVFGATNLSGGSGELRIQARDIVIDGFLVTDLGIGASFEVIDTDKHEWSLRNCVYINNDGPFKMSHEGMAGTQELLIENCRFVSNGRMDGMAAFDNSGGALALRVSNTLVRGCEFRGNQKGAYGAAIGALFDDSGVPEALSLTVQDSTFTGNLAGHSGGAIWWTKGSRLNVSHCEFLENLAGIDGGAISMWEAEANVIGSLFLGNAASNAYTLNPGQRDPIHDYYQWVDLTPTGQHTNYPNGVEPPVSGMTRFGGAVSNRSGELNMVNCTLTKNFVRYDPAIGQATLEFNPWAFMVHGWGAGVAHLVVGEQAGFESGSGDQFIGGPRGKTDISGSILWGNFSLLGSTYTLRWHSQVAQGYAFSRETLGFFVQLPFSGPWTTTPCNGQPNPWGYTTKGRVNYAHVPWFRANCDSANAEGPFFSQHNPTDIRLNGCAVQNFRSPLGYAEDGTRLLPGSTIGVLVMRDPLVGFGAEEQVDALDPNFVLLAPIVGNEGPNGYEDLVDGGPLEMESFIGDLRLKPDSPYIDRASEFFDLDRFLPGFQSLLLKSTDWYFGPVDLDGKPRLNPFSAGVDYGAYEN